MDQSDLSAYNGQTIRFAFRGVEGATDGAADLELFVDNFTVEIVPIAITVSAPVAICNGESTTLTVSSANPNYVYTWSPATGLSTTSGVSVVATPTATTTYTVTAVDGFMSATGSITVTVNTTPNQSTLSSNSPVCEGTNLNLTKHFLNAQSSVHCRQDDGVPIAVKMMVFPCYFKYGLKIYSSENGISDGNFRFIETA